MNTPTTPELVPFNSGLRSKVRTIVVRAPEVQDARFQPGPSGAMPLAAVDHAKGLMRSGLRANQIKYLAELHPANSMASVAATGSEILRPSAPSIDDILGEAELRLEPARGEAADLPAPVRHFGDDMQIEVQPKPAAFMAISAEVVKAGTAIDPTPPQGALNHPALTPLHWWADCSTHCAVGPERCAVLAPLAAAYYTGGDDPARAVLEACRGYRVNNCYRMRAWELAMNAVHGPVGTHPLQEQHPEVVRVKTNALAALITYLSV